MQMVFTSEKHAYFKLVCISSEKIKTLQIVVWYYRAFYFLWILKPCGYESLQTSAGGVCRVDSENMTHWATCTWEETTRFICWRKCVRAHRLKTTIKALRAYGSFPVFPREMERKHLKMANNTFIMCLFKLFTCKYDKIREGDLRCRAATDRTKHYERGQTFLTQQNNFTK